MATKLYNTLSSDGVFLDTPATKRVTLKTDIAARSRPTMTDTTVGKVSGPSPLDTLAWATKRFAENPSAKNYSLLTSAMLRYQSAGCCARCGIFTNDGPCACGAKEVR